ncbi:hypothetical protein GLYMA_17G162567v4 [Glycine max]|nr:hypothetical protein GLYMA_17G162567v4 [Glycine max]KAH1118709.1 hypothetical protein GYH30_047472 [Glycine max]
MLDLILFFVVNFICHFKEAFPLEKKCLIKHLSFLLILPSDTNFMNL